MFTSCADTSLKLEECALCYHQRELVKMVAVEPQEARTVLETGMNLNQYLGLAQTVQNQTLSQFNIIYDKFDKHRLGFFTIDDFERVTISSYCLIAKHP
jgi:hypothetical protein